MSNYNLIAFIIFCFFAASCSSSLHLSRYSYADKSFSNPTNQKIKYGINGHSVRVNRGEYTSQYNQFTISEQVELLRKQGVNIYRTDIYIDETGFFNGPDSPAKFEELVKQSKASNIEILPAISTYPWMKAYNDSEEPFIIGSDWDYFKLVGYINKHVSEGSEYIQSLEMWKHYYKRGLATGNLFGEKYGDKLTYYNTGNEIGYYISKMYPHPDNPIQNPTPQENEEFFFNNYKGDEMNAFFSCEEYARRTIASVAYVKGLIDGIKSIDNNARCIISEGKINFGFFKFLDYMNVAYDIIGWNWYENNFARPNPKYYGYNVYEELNKIGNGKPIWIVETNRTAGSRNYSGESVYQAEIDQAIILRQYVEQFSSLSNLEAVLVYELIDQEYSFETRWEDYYGLITSPFPDKNNARIKPAFDMYRYSIEEIKHGREDYLYAVLSDLTGTEPENSVISYWTEKMSKMRNLEFFLKEVHTELNAEFPKVFNKKISKETVNELISPYYQKYLKREPLKKESRYWKRHLKKNPDWEAVPVQIMLSEEYWENAVWAGYERRTGFNRPD